MEIRVVDFDILTQNYKTYQDGIKNMNDVKQSFIKKLEPVRREMEEIIKSTTSGLAIGEKDQEEKEILFNKIQEQGVQIDNDFKTTMRNLQTELNKKTYDELSIIITEWSKVNSIDLVLGKMEVVHLTDKYEITNDILEIIKEKDLYTNCELNKNN